MTIDEAINKLNWAINNLNWALDNNMIKNVQSAYEYIEAVELAIKALEQEPIIDKIRAEIEQITDTMGVSYNQYVSKIDVLQIIDKYRSVYVR